MRIAVLLLLGLLVGCGDEAVPDEHEPSDDALALWDEAFGEAEQGRNGKADSARCSGVIVPDRDGFQKRVALTFDDGPNPTTTPIILDILAERGILATFFINGKRVTDATQRAILARMLEEGHIIANHSHNHTDLKKASRATLDSEVRRTHEVLVEAGEERRWFRFPYGSSSCSTAQFVRDEFGYTVTGWHVDSADWCFASSTGGVGHCASSTFKWVPDGFRSDMVGYTVSQTKTQNGGILLFHDIHKNTADALPEIIDQLEEAGFTFATLNDEGVFPLLNGVEPPARPWVGDVCAADADCGFEHEGKAGFCNTWMNADGSQTFGFCSLPCEGTCPDQSGKASTFCTSLDEGSGACVSFADELNAQCRSIPGVVAADRPRFVGSSGAAQRTALVCVPE